MEKGKKKGKEEEILKEVLIVMALCVAFIVFEVFNIL